MECTYSGEYKKGNKSCEKLMQFNKIFTEDIELGKSVIDNLLNDDNPNVVIWISDVSIELQYADYLAVDKLRKIAQDEKLGIISFEAEMLLEVKGYI